MVVGYLPSLTGRYAAEVFGFGLEERHWRHSSVWNKIWKDNLWTSCATEMGLDPFLVGDGLHCLIKDPNQPARIALLTGDKTGQIRRHRTQLLLSLRPHHLNERNEAVFCDSGIILNVGDALYNTYYTILSPESLFTYHDNYGLRSGSLFWHDSEYALRTIVAEDVVGVGGPASNLLAISFMCGITLTLPREISLVGRRQYRFQHPNCPPISPLLPVVYTSDGAWVLGWAFVDDNRAEEI